MQAVARLHRIREAGGYRVKPDSSQELPANNGECPETLQKASPAQGLKTIDRHGPRGCVPQCKKDLQQIEAQGEAQRPWPTPAKMLYSDSKQARASHRDNASEQDESKAVTR